MKILCSWGMVWHKNHASMIASEKIFLCPNPVKPWKIGHTGGLWVLSTPDTLQEIVRMSPIFLHYSLAILCIFTRVMVYLEEKVIEYCNIWFNKHGTHWVGNASLCLRGRSTETVYNLAQYVQWTVPLLKVQVSQFLSFKGLEWSGHIGVNSTNSNSAPNNPLYQGWFVKGKSAVNLSGRVE